MMPSIVAPLHRQETRLSLGEALEDYYPYLLTVNTKLLFLTVLSALFYRNLEEGQCILVVPAESPKRR